MVVLQVLVFKTMVEDVTAKIIARYILDPHIQVNLLVMAAMVMIAFGGTTVYILLG